MYKFPNLKREAIAAMLDLISMKETRVYKDALEEGRQEGQYALISRQLSRKLGELDDELLGRVRELSNQQLEVLGDRLLDFSSVKDLSDCLDSLLDSL